MFDSHCHLTDEQFAADLAAVLERARAAGVHGVVTIASDAADATSALALATAHPDVWATAGVHPHAAGTATAEDYQRIVALLREPRVVAIGETGLDYFYDNAPRDVQRHAFEWHLEQARTSGKPVVVHSRNADDDVAAMIRAAAGARGVLHCFSGGRSLLATALELGWYISLAGPVTYRKYDAADLLRSVPDERLLIETDAPYLAPVPQRGKRNEPALLEHTCAAVARWREQDVAEVAAQTERNARAFYGLDLGDG